MTATVAAGLEGSKCKGKGILSMSSVLRLCRTLGVGFVRGERLLAIKRNGTGGVVRGHWLPQAPA